jgi:hypothetical protein
MRTNFRRSHEIAKPTKLNMILPILAEMSGSIRRACRDGRRSNGDRLGNDSASVAIGAFT